MRALLILAAGAAALGFAGAAAAAPSVKIKDAVARVVVIPEARSDVKVEFITTNKSLPLNIRRNGAETIVDGDLRMNKIGSCNTKMGATTIKVRGVGEVKWEDIPQIVVRTPLNVEVSGGGAVFGSVGRSDSVELANAGCGDWTVANVKGKLEVSQAGSGDTNVGTAGSAEISIAGSGSVKTQEVAGDYEVSIAGSGDAGAASVGGKIEVNIAGSGDVTIAGGRARSLDVSIMGSGDVSHNGEVGDVEVSVAGSGDVRVAKATGSVSKSVAGSGDVYIGR
jgi:hypothetical protein